MAKKYTTTITKTVEAEQIKKVERESNGLLVIVLEDDTKFNVTGDQIERLGGDPEAGDWYITNGHDEYIESELVFDSIYKEVAA